MSLTTSEIRKIIQIARNNDETPCFRRMDLAGADLAGIDLAGADFWGANLEEADFEAANLEGASFCRAVLSQATFYRTHMKGTNLARANLDGAKIESCTLTNADFSEVDLRATSIVMCDLTGAKLFNTIFFARALSNSNLEGAEYSPETVWPDGFDYKAATRRGKGEPTGSEDGLSMYRVCFSDGAVIQEEASSGGDAMIRASATRYGNSDIPPEGRASVTVVQPIDGRQGAAEPAHSKYSVSFDFGVVFRNVEAKSAVEAAILAHAETINDGFGEFINGKCDVRDMNTGKVSRVELNTHASVRIASNE